MSRKNEKELLKSHVERFEKALDTISIYSINEYKYIMEGFNNDWVYTDASRRFAIFSNMEPGDYVFRVMGTNNDGIWNDKEVTIKIIILFYFLLKNNNLAQKFNY